MFVVALRLRITVLLGECQHIMKCRVLVYILPLSEQKMSSSRFAFTITDSCNKRTLFTTQIKCQKQLQELKQKSHFTIVLAVHIIEDTE